jgi:hypothetical protein
MSKNAQGQPVWYSQEELRAQIRATEQERASMRLRESYFVASRLHNLARSPRAKLAALTRRRNALRESLTPSCYAGVRIARS